MAIQLSSGGQRSTTLLLLLLLLLLLFSTSSAITELEQAQIDLFQQYLRINTAHPSPDYAAATSFLSSQGHSIGLRSQTFFFSPNKPLLLLSWPGSDPSLPSILLNSHIDSVPVEPSKWSHPPFAAHRDPHGRIFARGSQDDKCLAVQYLEALRALKASGFSPLRSIHVSFVPDEEIGGADGAARFAESDEFKELNVGFVLDEGQASPTDEFRVFYADRLPWSLIVKAVGSPGHGSRLYDGAALENLMECVEAIARFRDNQFDLVKEGLRASSEVISVNTIYMKAGIPSPTGFVMNMQPSEGEVGYDVRVPPTVDIGFLRTRLDEEWAPVTRNMTYELFPRGPKLRDNGGRPLATATDESNPWWSVFEKAVIASGGKLSKPEILASTTDARFMRQWGIPALGFSPMTNTPILLHEHNEHLKDTVFLKGIKVYEHIISALSSFPANSS
ncbi:hypothetical protein J5N97_002875 [Dioscorea zingiberensis]|uniref:N-acyl-aliphatic-L-amino acid amidohydrolase n=1 Tax=Dioscorea zingiberensis TaxID=325984 RepID=A0A9D5D4R0_9LILI|nr:hypothetical protein J5N97_002875 [Dioscorea zingiberensis]